MVENLRSLVGGVKARLSFATASYGLREFPRVLHLRHEALLRMKQALHACAARSAETRLRRLTAAANQLRALSPRNVLERGYCLARGPDGSLVRVASELTPGQLVQLEFGRGEADARIEAVRPGETK
jgi:exodeoxyribonuclease VII large subunit